jgi:hypothetical protein
VKFAKLTSRERNRQPGKFDLQYEVVEAGCKIVVCHEERGTRGEILREGDEVIVPARIPSAWSPVFQSDDRKFKIYRQELQAAGPPTHKMQHSPKDEYFYIPDPVPPQGPALPKRRAW